VLFRSEAYELGLRYLNRASYTKALEQFNRVRTYYRDDPVALKAELAIADIHYRKDEWDAARIAYEDFMRAHPRYGELDYVVFRLGMVLYKKAPLIASRDQQWTRQAVNTWAGFSARFPESRHLPEVDKHLRRARERLARKEYVIADFYRGRKAWPAVIGRAEGLLRQYPDSSEAPASLAMLTEAYAATGAIDQAKLAVEKLRATAPGYPGLGRAQRALEKAQPPSP
jgi:outer membrane protein assembly factor BamD